MEDARALILRFSQPSLVCSSRDVGRICRLVEICKWLQRSVARAFLQRHAEAPVLITYGSDCTPLVTKRRFVEGWRDLCVRRSGMSSGDWLIQRVFLLSGDGERQTVVEEPKLLEDKSAWAHWAAFRNCFQLGREAGHSGLCVSHQVYDRAICSAMTRHHKQMHLARKLFEETTAPPGQARLSWLLSWCTTVACVNHDVHNSLRWAIAPWCESKSCMRGLFITLESLRRSYSELIAHLPKWLSEKVVFEDCAALGAWQRVWTLCGLPPKWVDQLVELELRYEHGHLKVGAKWEDDPELPQLLMTLMLKLWEWRRFSDSRWASMGASCRSMLAACLSGLPDFVGEVLANPSAHTFYLKGFLYMTGEVKALVALIACSSFIADTLLAELMEDDRLPMRHDGLQQELLRELEYIEALEMPVFEIIGGVCVWHERLHLAAPGHVERLDTSRLLRRTDPAGNRIAMELGAWAAG